MKHLFTMLSLSLLMACGGSEEEQSVAYQLPAVETDFAAFSHDFLEAYLALHPKTALLKGRYEFADRLRVNDDAFREELRAFIADYGRALRAFDPARMDAEAAIDWAIIDNKLQSLSWYQDSFREYQWNPAKYNVATAIGRILNTDYAPLESRLAQLDRRLQQVPAYYAAAEANISKPTLPHTELAIEQNRAAIEVLQGSLKDAVNGADLDADRRDSLLQNMTAASEAVAAYIAYLEAMLPGLQADKARDFRIGEKHYEQKFALDINSGLSAGAVYKMALAERDRVHAEMIGLSRQTWSKYFPDQLFPTDALAGVNQLLREISKQHVEADDFIDAVRAQIRDLERFVSERELLELDPSRPLVVRAMPAYLRGSALANVQAPGPFAPEANTYYNVDPLAGYAPDRLSSYMREYNVFTTQIFNIHEAVPGHYTQLQHANKAPSPIKAVFDNGAMIEGWAVYTERMMMEAGYGGIDNPELWLMFYKWNLRAVINTILDYSIQVLGMEEAAAMDLLVRQGFQELAEAQMKWRRASLSQVQLASYFTGYMEIYAFREQQRGALGEDFSLKDFHNRFLSYGSAPVRQIKQAFRENR